MRKRTKLKSRFLDSLVILSCLAAATFFIWLFWQDLNAFTVRTDKTEIGVISFKHNVAQRKFDDRVVWERVTSGTKLYYGDTIRTADLAQAIIELKDGTILDLAENTMIQVSFDERAGVKIAIDGGDIQIDSSSASSSVALELDDGSVVNVDAGSSLAAKSDPNSGVHNVEVKSGSAQVTTDTGETAVLAYGESVNVEKGKEIQKNPVTVIYPPKDLKLLNIRGEAVPVKFEWKAGSDDSVTVQTSRFRDFSSIETKQTLQNVTGTEVSVSEGVLYWRAYTEDTRDKAVEGKISVEKIHPVAGISPATASEFRYRTVLPRVAFRWTGNEFAERYRLVVSSTPDMKRVVRDVEASGTFVSIDSLEAGDYWWQVTPFYSLNNIGYEGASDVRSFKVIRNEQIRPPELSAPAENAQIVYRENIPANFIWKSELKNASYELTIARDMTFTTVVFQTETKEPRFTREFTPTELRDGTYYWRIVRKSDDEDDINPESETRTFKIVRYIPQDNKLVYPPENFSTEQSKLSSTAFMWKLADEYDSASAVSVLQISPSPAFSSIQLERSGNASFMDNISVPAGTYWWRVGVRDEKGALTALTQPRMFTVLSEMGIPDFITPAQNQELVTYNSAPVSLSWTSVSGADYYAVKVYAPSGELLKQQNEVRALSAQFVLDEGNYVCRVQAVSEDSDGTPRMGQASSRSFSLRSPSAIMVQSPVDGTRIDGLTALRMPITFTWVSGRDKVSTYNFVLSKVQNDGSVKLVETVPVQKTSIARSRLTEGTYIWKIVASTSAGIPVDSAESRFVIESIGELEKAVLESPAQNLVMDADYLRNHRTLEFSWGDVSGATAYTFVLYKREANGSRKAVFTERNTKTTMVRIKDLSILDVGTFEWSVTPYAYAKDGYLEQKGQVATRTFSIDFASPTRVETVQPGKLYGN